MNFPFEQDATAYAYVTARNDNGFAHLNLYMCLPSLARMYPEDAVTLNIHSQASEGNPGKPEPFYAIRLEASASSSGMGIQNCERAVKSMRALIKGVKKIDDLAGSPAELLQDIFIRHIRAARIEHVYLAPSLNARGPIPDWPHFTGDRMSRLRDELTFLKIACLKSVNLDAA